MNEKRAEGLWRAKMKHKAKLFSVVLASIAVMTLTAGLAPAASSLEGQVLGGGAPIANSMVTLWAASAGEPKQLAQVHTGADGRFALNVASAPGKDSTLYLVAKGGRSSADKTAGDNPAIALMTVVGSKPPARVTINEMTTIASVWTHNQFIDGTAIKGQPLQLKIAAGNVPSFVDLANRRLGRRDSGPAQRRPDADDGELRDAGQCARRLRHAGDA